MRIDILTIFPDIFAPLDASVAGRAKKAGVFRLYIHDIRDYSEDEHRTVDDRPYGGGPGMVMKPEPIVRAVEAVRAKTGGAPRIILMSPGGRKYSQEEAVALAAEDHIVIICGRYEGVDERVIECLAAEEVSIGDYVLCGGEIPAMAVVESVVRLLPGALGDEDSAKEESFSGGMLEYPHYTRPESFRGMKVPPILLSGNHGQIRLWRKDQALKRTKRRRPDLFPGGDSPEE